MSPIIHSPKSPIMSTFASTHRSGIADLPQDDIAVRTRKRRNAVMLSAICTTIVLVLATIVAVEKQASQSARAAWLRQSPFSRPANLHTPQQSTAKRRKKRQLEDRQDEEDRDNEEEEDAEEEEDNNREDERDEEEEEEEDRESEDNSRDRDEDQDNQDDYYAMADDAVADDDEQEVLQTYPPGKIVWPVEVEKPMMKV